MKYNVDSVVKGERQKVHKPTHIQKKISPPKRRNGMKRMYIFVKKNRKFIIITIGLVIVSVVAGFFVVRKNLATLKNEAGRDSKQISVEDKREDDVDEQESNVFHIVINTKEFKVDADVIEGASNEDLHKGVVHQKGSAFPSQHGGNVVITGHRWYPGDGQFSKVFENMDKLKKGDKVTLQYKNKKYIYSIDNWKIVGANNTKLLEHTNEPQLTIYTCHPKFTSQQRLVYRAHLDSVEERE